MLISDLQFSRIAAMEALGGACKNCGNADYRVLRVVNTIKGAGAELRRKISREKYFLLALRDIRSNPATTPYTLLCANCQAIRMASGGDAAVAATRRIVVWKPECDAEIAHMNHPWLDRYLTNGFEVFVYFKGEVFCYKDKQVIGDWAEFQKAIGAPEVKPPVDSVMNFEVAA